MVFTSHMFLQLPIPTVLNKPVAAGLALALVELFEAFNGFGVMTNTYDPFDFVANTLGVGLALVLDTALRFRARAPLAGDGIRGAQDFTTRGIPKGTQC
jgi:hypothetical protein